MYTRILVPTDFSKASYAAFKPAMELAKKFRAHVLLLHVVEDVPVYAHHLGVSRKELLGRIVEHTAEAMRAAGKQLRVKNADLIVRIGNAEQEVLRVVKERKVDLIVMGTHGRNGFARTLVGSVAEKIVRSAPCHVLTVKPRR